MVSFFAGVKFFRFWPKTMDYSPWFSFLRVRKKVLRKVYRFKENKNRSLMAFVSVA